MTTQIALIAEMIFQTALKPALSLIVPPHNPNWSNITRFSLVMVVYILNILNAYTIGHLTGAAAWNLLIPSIQMGLGIIGGYHVIVGVSAPPPPASAPPSVP